MSKESTSRDAPENVSKLIARSVTSSRLDNVCNAFESRPVDAYVRNLVSTYLQKPSSNKQAFSKKTSKANSKEKDNFIISEQSSLSKIKEPSFKSIVEDSNSNCKLFEKNENSKKSRPSSSSALNRLPFTRFTGRPNPEPVLFSIKHPNLVLDPNGNNDDDGRYLFHRRKDLNDKAPLTKNTVFSSKLAEFKEKELSRKKIVSSSDDDAPRESLSSSLVFVHEKPEVTWHETFKCRSKKSSPLIKKSSKRSASKTVSPKPKSKGHSPVLKIISNSPKVEVVDKRGLISKLEAKAFPVMSIKDKCNSVQKVVSISIEPQEVTLLRRNNNVHYFECVHEEVSAKAVEIPTTLDTSLITSVTSHLENVSLNEKSMSQKESPKKNEKNAMNRYVRPFLKRSSFCLEEVFFNQVSFCF